MTEKQTPGKANSDPFLDEARRRAKARLEAPGQQRPRHIGRKVLIGATLAASAGLGIAGLVDSSNHPEDGHNNESIAEAFQSDTSVTELDVSGDARFRSAPNTDPSNILLQYNGADVAINTPGGVYESHDENGTWYGVNRSQLPESIQTGGINNRISKDGDGIIWINEQTAAPVKTVIGDVDTSTDNPSDPTNLAGLNN